VATSEKGGRAEERRFLLLTLEIPMLVDILQAIL
jgi:hypothetical protein